MYLRVFVRIYLAACFLLHYNNPIKVEVPNFAPNKARMPSAMRRKKGHSRPNKSMLSRSNQLNIENRVRQSLVIESSNKKKKFETTNDSTNKIHNEQTSKICRLLKWIAAIMLLTFLMIFVIFPVTFFASNTVQEMMIFMNYLGYPLQSPQHYGLRCTRSLLVPSNDGIQIGIWHIPANEKHCDHTTQQIADRMFADDKTPVVLYAHGVGGTRASRHRVDLYKVLSNQLNMNVIALDYRGYGDSSASSPSSVGLVNDTAAVYRWLLSQPAMSAERIFVWGHSLGSGVTIRFLAVTETATANSPRAAILEAPFTTMQDALYSFPLLLPFRLFPHLFDYIFVQPIVQNARTNFDSIALLDRVRCPLLILHAQDDMIVPFRFGKQLHDEAQRVQPKDINRAQFVAFASDKGHGHRNIAYDSQLPQIIFQFINSLG